MGTYNYNITLAKSYVSLYCSCTEISNGYTNLWIVQTLTSPGSFTMDCKSILCQFLLGIKASSQSTKFIQLDSIILGLKKCFIYI